jgi:hypothetical protein
MIKADFNFQRISAQMERILFSLDYVARHRFGTTIQDLHESQKDRFGVCERTTARDISTMLATGIIMVRTEDGKKTFSLNPAMKLGQLLASGGDK